MFQTHRSKKTRRAATVARGRLRLAVLCVLALTWGTPALAEPEDTPARKLGRGLANTTLGVLAIPGTIADVSRERGPFVGVTWGLVKGTGYFAATEVVGVFELLTAPFAVPPDYEPFLGPEFPWQHFTGETREVRPDPKPRRRRTVR